MATTIRKTNTFIEVIRFMSLSYHGAVKDVRSQHRNALVGLFMEMFQSLSMVAFFALFIIVLSRGANLGVRGNFILYVMTGVFLYMCHIKAMQKVVQSGKPTNPMLQHAPVTTLLNIVSASLGGLYLQVLSIGVLLFITHMAWEPVEFYDLKRAGLCFFIAWFSGFCVGILFVSLGVFFPQPVVILSVIYARINMIFSGKMVLASTLPAMILPAFSWNPLFHAIDQARGATFINYTAKVTSLEYAIWCSVGVMIVGFMIEHWGRKYASESWNSRS